MWYYILFGVFIIGIIACSYILGRVHAKYDMKPDGVMLVNDHQWGLNVNKPLEDIPKMKYIVFEVRQADGDIFEEDKE